MGAGKFETIVIRPVIRNTGLFAEDANGEIHVSDDYRRLIVYMKADLPLVNLTFHLEEIREGVPLGGWGGLKPPDGRVSEAARGDGPSRSGPVPGPPGMIPLPTRESSPETSPRSASLGGLGAGHRLLLAGAARHGVDVDGGCDHPLRAGHSRLGRGGP